MERLSVTGVAPVSLVAATYPKREWDLSSHSQTGAAIYATVGAVVLGTLSPRFLTATLSNIWAAFPYPSSSAIALGVAVALAYCPLGRAFVAARAGMARAAMPGNSANMTTMLRLLFTGARSKIGQDASSMNTGTWPVTILTYFLLIMAPAVNGSDTPSSLRTFFQYLQLSWGLALLVGASSFIIPEHYVGTNPYLREPRDAKRVPVGTRERIGVLVCNLGTPSTAEPDSVGTFLSQFLADQRVVEVARFVWLPLLRCIIVPIRKYKSSVMYKRLFAASGNESPLYRFGLSHTAALQKTLGDHYSVKMCMSYSSPTIPEAVAALKKEGIQRYVVFHAYPQYSGTTTASIYDAVFQAAAAYRFVPTLRVIEPYYAEKDYIDALVAVATAQFTEWTKSHPDWRVDHTVLSYHGIPIAYVQRGDPYPQHCAKTSELLAKALNLKDGEWTMTFQSQFGYDPWLTPATDRYLDELAAKGRKNVVVLCPGFMTDCLETIDEIGSELKHAFLHAGGESLSVVPCLNDHPAWVAASARLITRTASGWP